MNLGAPLQIEGISFEETHVSVVYSERHEQGRRVQTVRTMLVDPSLVEEELTEVIEAINGLIDRALLEDRNPPERLPVRPS